MFKWIVIGLLLAIVGALGSALFSMLGQKRDPNRMARALTVRVALSVGLFLLLLLGMATGLLSPHGLD